MQTLHRRGYRFIAPVQAIGAESSARGQADFVQRSTPAGASDGAASAASPPSQTFVSGQAQAELPVPPSETGTRAPAQARLAWLVTALCLVGLLAVSFVHFRETPPDTPCGASRFRRRDSAPRASPRMAAISLSRPRPANPGCGFELWRAKRLGRSLGRRERDP